MIKLFKVFLFKVYIQFYIYFLINRFLNINLLLKKKNSKSINPSKNNK